MTRRRRPSIPQIPKGLGREEQRFYASVKEALDISMGDRGNELESNPTWRDLLSYGFAERAPSGGWVPTGGTATDPTVITDIPGLPDYNNTSTPPQPTGAAISVGVNNVYLTWDNPQTDWLEYAEIYHVEVPIGDPAPLVASATFLARTFPNGGAYAHSVDPETRHFYWIRFVSYRGNYGAWHATAGLEAITELLPQQQLDAITDAINNGQLATDLQASISAAQLDATQAIADAASANAAAAVISGDLDSVEGEIIAAREGEASLVANLNSIYTTLEGQVTGVQNEIFLARDGEATLAAKLTNITATADAAANTATTTQNELITARNGEADLASHLSSITASVGALNTVVVDEISRVDDSLLQVNTRVDDVSAEYFIKTDVNGLVSGFGIFNDGLGSDMIFNVNRFAVGAPGQASFTFVVDNNTNSVLMDGAKIVDATITSAKIDNITVDQIVGDVANFVNANITSVNVNTIVGDTSTFVESNIGVGAINTAMIDFGAVNTLKIAGNAISITLSGTRQTNTTFYKEYTWDVASPEEPDEVQVLSVPIPSNISSLNEPFLAVINLNGAIFCRSTLSYSTNIVRFAIKSNGQYQYPWPYQEFLRDFDGLPARVYTQVGNENPWKGFKYTSSDTHNLVSRRELPWDSTGFWVDLAAYSSAIITVPAGATSVDLVVYHAKQEGLVWRSHLDINRGLTMTVLGALR